MSSYSYAPRTRSVRAAAFIAALVVLPTVGAIGSVALGRTTTTSATKRPDDPASLHMLMTPARRGTTADTIRAQAIASILRKSIAKYRDTTAAVADGYKMFAPQIKQQKVYHFTNSWLAVQEAFRFDPAKPTSLLYKKSPSGEFILVGAMYVAPKRFNLDQLDERIPLSIARWHKHVNWCIPGRGDSERWLERKDGHPIFGPESPIATKDACDAVHGAFRETIFSWMVHANVFAGDDPHAIWGDEHAGHDMHDGMKMDGAM